MAEYINKKDILRLLTSSPVWTGLDAIARVNAMDSIDIVRCKECKYEPICNHSVQHTTHEPTSVTIGCKAVEFCSYGERKSDGINK